MKNKKFCKYFDAGTNNCDFDDCNNHCRALEGKSCSNYEKYDCEQDLLNRILELETRVRKLEEIIAFSNFEVD